MPFFLFESTSAVFAFQLLVFFLFQQLFWLLPLQLPSLIFPFQLPFQLCQQLPMQLFWQPRLQLAELFQQLHVLLFGPFQPFPMLLAVLSLMLLFQLAMTLLVQLSQLYPWQLFGWLPEQQLLLQNFLLQSIVEEQAQMKLVQLEQYLEKPERQKAGVVSVLDIPLEWELHLLLQLYSWRHREDSWLQLADLWILA